MKTVTPHLDLLVEILLIVGSMDKIDSWMVILGSDNTKYKMGQTTIKRWQRSEASGSNKA